MQPLRRRKPTRLYSAVAVAGGVLLLWFEISRWQRSEPDKWFWLLIAGLMILLGLIGVVSRPSDAERP